MNECGACLAPAGPNCDDPVKLLDAPLGQYHCPGCGVMQVAGIPHMPCPECKGTGRWRDHVRELAIHVRAHAEPVADCDWCPHLLATPTAPPAPRPEGE